VLAVVVAILATACSGPTSAADVTTPPAGTSAGRADFAGLVDVGGGDKLYVECRGSGSPTVVLISTANGTSDEWKSYADMAQQKLVQGPMAVFPSIARHHRTCVYDRPGTRRNDGQPSPSTMVHQPTTAGGDLRVLRAGLSGAGEHPPYVLGAGSWGAMIALLYARVHPTEVKGLALVDGASPFLPTALTAQPWQAFLAVADGLDPRQYEIPDYPASLAELAAAGPVPAGLAAVVLSSSAPWQLVPSIPATETFPRWTTAQNDLAAALSAEHVTRTDSQHLITLQNPEVVTTAITTLLGRL
jgi:pimeloyl-ACP methyl ester carboxylesterase